MSDLTEDTSKEYTLKIPITYYSGGKPFTLNKISFREPKMSDCLDFTYYGILQSIKRQEDIAISVLSMMDTVKENRRESGIPEINYLLNILDKTTFSLIKDNAKDTGCLIASLFDKIKEMYFRGENQEIISPLCFDANNKNAILTIKEFNSLSLTDGQNLIKKIKESFFFL